MSTIEMKSTTPEEDQKNSSNVLTEISTPINFAESTAADFVISVQSFIPASLPSPNRKDKSRLAQLKARRRSNIGVRGSPETNSLIRFIAQQRMKTPPAQTTPEVTSTLRQKMACFQSLMGVEESEDGGAGGCITTRDDLSDGENLNSGKENHPPSLAVPPNKTRRLGPTRGCEEEITEDDLPRPPLHFSLEQLEEEDASVKDKPLELSKTEEASAQALVISPPFTEGEQSVSPDAQLWSSTENQQEVVSELERIHQPRPDDPSAASAAPPASHFHSPSISSLLEMKPSGKAEVKLFDILPENNHRQNDCEKNISPPMDSPDGSPNQQRALKKLLDSLSSPTVRRRKKQVRFGEPLPPELFDKTLPPSTPLQKGGTPARAPTPGDALKRRSLLKTPQRSDSRSTQQPELCSPSVFASPTLTMPRCPRMATSEDDSEEEMSGKIPFPMEEIENEAAIAEESLNAQLLKLETAFNEDSFSHSETECETKAVERVSPMAIPPREPLQEEKEPSQTDTEAPASATTTTSSRGGKETHDTTEAPARSGGRKRKLPEESEPVKRSSRSAAKTASGKMKADAATRRWNKKVDRTLYGSRAYASKNPALSPITERRSLGLSFSAEEPEASTAPGHEPHPELRRDGKSVSGDPATAAAPQTGATTTLNASTAPHVSPLVGDRKNGAQRSRRRSGSKGVGRALKEREVSVNDDRADGEVHDRSKERHVRREVTDEAKTSNKTVVKSDGDAGSDIGAMNSLTVKEESESPAILEEPPSFPAGKELKPALREAEPGQENEPDDKMDRQVDGAQGDGALSRRESTRSRSDEQEDEAAAAKATLSLPPWQDDFNFEDVFKPVHARGQCSVRRSLRNRSAADHSSDGGLAWLPHVSPESIKESRRRMRGRRLSVFLPTPALGEPQP